MKCTGLHAVFKNIMQAEQATKLRQKTGTLMLAKFMSHLIRRYMVDLWMCVGMLVSFGNELYMSGFSFVIGQEALKD